MKLPSYFTLIKIYKICFDCQLVFTFLFNHLIVAAELTEWMIFWFLCMSMSHVILTDIHWALKGCSGFSLIFFFFVKPVGFFPLNSMALELNLLWEPPLTQQQQWFFPLSFPKSLFHPRTSLAAVFLWTLLISPGYHCAETTLRGMPSLQKWLGVSWRTLPSSLAAVARRGSILNQWNEWAIKADCTLRKGGWGGAEGYFCWKWWCFLYTADFWCIFVAFRKMKLQVAVLHLNRIVSKGLLFQCFGAIFPELSS